MSGLDKIIKNIETSATETPTGILDKAKAQADEIVNSGKEAADKKEAAIAKQGELDAAATKKRIDSAAEQTLRKYILEAKQWEINKTIAAALDKIQALPADEYFEDILKMVGKYAPEKEGTIKFSAADLGRMPADLESRINKKLQGKGSLKISKEPVNINGGFILDYGDVEENCSLDALAESLKEKLQDEISTILFS